MNRSKWLTITQYVIINLVLVGIIFTLFFVFANSFETEYQRNYVNSFQKLLETKLDEKLTIDLDDFNNLVTNKTVSELNDDILNNNISHQTPYLSFQTIVNNTITYDGETYALSRNPLSHYDIAFFGNYFGFVKDNVVGIFDEKEYFSNVFSLSDATNIFIMDFRGEIFYHNNIDFNYLVLHEYFEFDTTHLFEEHFSNKVSEYTLTYSYKEQETLFVFTSLDSFGDLYIVQHFVVSDINAYASHYTSFLLILLVLFVGFSVLILLFIFYYLNKKTNDIEAKKMLYYYNKPYIIHLDKNHNIISINLSLKEELGRDIKHVSELSLDYNISLMNNRLDRGQSIPLIIDGNEYYFLSLKVKKGYYLIAKTDFEASVNPKLERLAYLSPVTNLPNHHKLVSDLDNHYEDLNAKRIEVVSLISLDIKGFRHINKNLKREAGDLVLKTVGERIKTLLVDHVESKLYSQGDLFTIILPNQTKQIAEKLVKTINNEFLKPVNVLKNKMTLNFVGAILELNSNNILDARDALTNLEETLKRAKELTTSNYYIFDETIAYQVTFRRQIEGDLLEAIKKGDFEVYLQPKYNYQTDKIVGFESLVRWNHPQYFKVSPLEYITLAEENGLIVKLGNIIKTKTFEAAKALEKYNMQISLNISPIEIMQPGFIDDFLKEYRKFNFRENTIIVELTETAIIESINVVNEKLAILHKNGILVHLDDFGTGYSTLPYIKDLRFDAIKIDKVYIDYIDTDSYSKAIVNMIISLAKTLNLTVIAEGVEHERQMKELAKLGCYIIQGYLISPAINLESALKLIEDYNVTNIKTFKGGKK